MTVGAFPPARLSLGPPPSPGETVHWRPEQGAQCCPDTRSIRPLLLVEGYSSTGQSAPTLRFDVALGPQPRHEFDEGVGPLGFGGQIGAGGGQRDAVPVGQCLGGGPGPLSPLDVSGRGSGCGPRSVRVPGALLPRAPVEALHGPAVLRGGE